MKSIGLLLSFLTSVSFWSYDINWFFLFLVLIVTPAVYSLFKFYRNEEEEFKVSLINLFVMLFIFSMGFYGFGHLNTCLSIICLSFYSAWAVLFSYGCKAEILFLLIFKMIWELGFCVLLWSFFFLKLSESGDYSWLDLLSFKGEIGGLGFIIESNRSIFFVFFISFTILGLLGPFMGIWLFLAMSTRHLLSIYVHSSGFIGSFVLVSYQMVGSVGSFSMVYLGVLIVCCSSLVCSVFIFIAYRSSFILNVKKLLGLYSIFSIILLSVSGFFFPNKFISIYVIAGSIKIVFFCLSSSINSKAFEKLKGFSILSNLVLFSLSIVILIVECSHIGLVISKLEDNGWGNIVLMGVFFVFLLKNIFLIGFWSGFFIGKYSEIMESVEGLYRDFYFKSILPFPAFIFFLVGYPVISVFFYLSTFISISLVLIKGLGIVAQLGSSIVCVAMFFNRITFVFCFARDLINVGVVCRLLLESFCFCFIVNYWSFIKVLGEEFVLVLEYFLEYWENCFCINIYNFLLYCNLYKNLVLSNSILFFLINIGFFSLGYLITCVFL